MAGKTDIKPEELISEKSTKAEILAAYKKIVQEAANPEKEEKGEKKPSQAKQKEYETCDRDTIIMGVSTLKINIGKYLAELETQLIEKSDKLTGIIKSIEDAQKKLKEIHDIEVAADTLVNLLKYQDDNKNLFIQEMTDARLKWEKEQKEHELQVKERDSAVKKERERESEEYKYHTELTRKKQKNALEEEMAMARKAFEEKVKTKEEEIAGREENIHIKEAEFEELTKKAEKFAEVLDKEVKEGEKRAVKATEERLKMDKLLLEKDMEREREVF
ncbi:MAG: hypothetical protein ABRQ37_26655, partial [Candidatus Eremiobacterota bacterium]